MTQSYILTLQATYKDSTYHHILDLSNAQPYCVKLMFNRFLVTHYTLWCLLGYQSSHWLCTNLTHLHLFSKVIRLETNCNFAKSASIQSWCYLFTFLVHAVCIFVETKYIQVVAHFQYRLTVVFSQTLKFKFFKR